MKTCSSCSNLFSCSSDVNCWCIDFPQVLEVKKEASCLCATCISERIAIHFEEHPDKAKSYWKINPDKERKKDSYEEGVDYYLNEAGNWVFTLYYHLKKGYCCKNKCLHCPYGLKKEVKL